MVTSSANNLLPCCVSMLLSLSVMLKKKKKTGRWCTQQFPALNKWLKLVIEWKSKIGAFYHLLRGTPRMTTSRSRIICLSRLEVPMGKSSLQEQLHPGWCETCQQLWSHRGRTFSSKGDPRQLAPQVQALLLGVLCFTYYSTQHSSLAVLGLECFLSAPSGLWCLHKAQGGGESLWK